MWTYLGTESGDITLEESDITLELSDITLKLSDITLKWKWYHIEIQSNIT